MLKMLNMLNTTLSGYLLALARTVKIIKNKRGTNDLI